MKYSRRILVYLILFVATNQVSAACLDVDGLTFEKVGIDTLLIMQSGKNLGLLQVADTFGGEMKSIRFFTPKICDSGESDKFQYNGNLHRVSKIQLFK